MSIATRPSVHIPAGLIETIQSFPKAKRVEHCGKQFSISPFAVYGECPQCGKRIKVRAFSAQQEVADVFDAVFEWMNQPGAEEIAGQRRKELVDDD